jgi:D-sedoheptulose 7-phosphate isomerase
MNASDESWVVDYLDQSASVLAALAAGPEARATFARFAEGIVASLQAGGKLMLAGNGGSAADAQHIAAAFVVRLMYDRAPLAAIALTTDSSILTAGGNDYGFEQVFERQVRALGRPGDVFLGISTSGDSPNVVRALAAARDMGIATLGFSGGDGGRMRDLCDGLFLAPARATALVQQAHLVAAHVICALVERTMFPQPEARP